MTLSRAPFDAPLGRMRAPWSRATKGCKSQCMKKDYPTIAKDLSREIAELRRGMPDTMKAFSGLAQAATADGVLDKKAKELIAIAIAITTRCDGCIAFHVKAGRAAGMNRNELLETIGMSVYMGGGPSMIYGAEALSAYDEFEEQDAAHGRS